MKRRSIHADARLPWSTLPRLGAAATMALAAAMLAAYPLVAQQTAPPPTEPPTEQLTAVAAPVPRAAAADQPAEDAADLPANRLREGTQLTDCLGHFRQNGESLTFVDDDGRELGGLPNLNLERISRMLKSVEEAESVAWSVSGTVTEFAGRNYLLVSRAVYKAASLPPAPDTLE